MVNKKTVLKKIKIPLFEFIIPIFFTNDDSFFGDEHKNTIAYTFHYRGAQPAAAFRNNEPLKINTIIHESVHLADDLFLYIGQERSKDEEMGAYLTAFIATQILKFASLLKLKIVL